MRKRAIEALQPKKPKKKGEYMVTVQQLDKILILNIYKNSILRGRYCMDTATHEYAQWDAFDKAWNKKKLGTLLGLDVRWYYCSPWGEGSKRLVFNSKKEESLVQKELQMKKIAYMPNTYELIETFEREYAAGMREKTERNRINRVNELMGRVPEIPEGIQEWLYEKEGAKDFVFYNKEKKQWCCSACGRKYNERYLHRADREKKIRHNDMVICPKCKKTVQAKKRTNKWEIITRFSVLQKIDEHISVMRHFDADIYWKAEKEREIVINEGVRLFMYQMADLPKYVAVIYYNQYLRGDGEWADFDNKSNPANRRMGTEWLYEENVEETLNGTAFQAWGRLFSQMAQTGRKLDYNRLMCLQNDTNMVEVVEKLFKGRFYKMLEETAERIDLWSLRYYGGLKCYGNTIEDVFDIGDRQKINRIRDMNGGYLMLSWMRWSQKEGKKISDRTLQWLLANDLEYRDLEEFADKMSVEQAMNYIERQRKESYKGKTIRQVISQYSDYIGMCIRLKKNIADEMVYKPRELKRRHDEAVFQIAEREAKLEAAEYSRRFPGVEDVLAEIKKKYEYEGEDYFIMVPEKCVDIVTEGRTLHHCAGSTDRYFDRIKQRETYICFLRKKTEPDMPYYTIEVEPGGTIRQHRGYLDEEPEIEQVRPFLKEWQKVIKQRIDKKDEEYAAASAIKRAENIEELKQKNNRRVLEGLMEDFMEAV